jgi:hypothetical protein
MGIDNEAADEIRSWIKERLAGEARNFLDARGKDFRGKLAVELEKDPIVGRHFRPGWLSCPPIDTFLANAPTNWIMACNAELRKALARNKLSSQNPPAAAAAMDSVKEEPATTRGSPAVHFPCASRSTSTADTTTTFLTRDTGIQGSTRSPSVCKPSVAARNDNDNGAGNEASATATAPTDVDDASTVLGPWLTNRRTKRKFRDHPTASTAAAATAGNWSSPSPSLLPPTKRARVANTLQILSMCGDKPLTPACLEDLFDTEGAPEAKVINIDTIRDHCHRVRAALSLPDMAAESMVFYFKVADEQEKAEEDGDNDDDPAGRPEEKLYPVMDNISLRYVYRHWLACKDDMLSFTLIHDDRI